MRSHEVPLIKYKKNTLNVCYELEISESKQRLDWQPRDRLYNLVKFYS